MAHHYPPESIFSLKLKEMIGLNTNEDDIHKEFRAPRLAKDENDVERVMSVIKGRVNPIDWSEELVCISSGVTVSPEIKQDLPEAERVGDTLVTEFLKDRIVSNNASFFDPLPPQNLKTFKDTVQTKKIKVNGKEHILKADRKLFGRLAVIAQSKALNIREVLKYPLGPLPWPLACTDGPLAKTNKAKLAEVLERSTESAVDDPECTAGIFAWYSCYKL